MNEGILSQGNIRSQQTDDYNKEVSRRNQILTKQIQDLQKQQNKIDTTNTDLKYSLQASENVITGLAGLKGFKSVKKELPEEERVAPETARGLKESETNPVQEISSAEAPAAARTASSAESIAAAARAAKPAAAAATEAAGKVAKTVGLAEIGEALGVAQGGEALTQDLQGKWKKMNPAEKVQNVAELVGGVADTAAIAVPFVAPVAAGVGFVAGIVGDVAGEIGDDKKQIATKSQDIKKKLGTLQSQKLDYKSTPIYSQIGLTSSPIHNTARITGSYGF